MLCYSSDLLFQLYFLCFNIMNPLEFSINIGLITYSLCLCSLRWRPVPGVFFFFFSICKPLWKKTWGKYIEHWCAKAPWNSQAERKRIGDIYPYLMMFWLYPVTCEYMQHSFIIMRGYTLIRLFFWYKKIGSFYFFSKEDYSYFITSVSQLLFPLLRFRFGGHFPIHFSICFDKF